MKLLEYEAKNILRQYNIPVPTSTVIRSANDITTLPVVLKSQVPVGGRGKAGGVKVVSNQEEAVRAAQEVLALSIKDFTPNVLLAEEPLDINREYYLSLLVNKTTATIQLMAHKNGGVEVEGNPEDSYLKITLRQDSFDTAGEQLADYFDLPGQTFALQDLVENLYVCFTQSDATLIEINPLVLTSDDKLVAGDCKMVLDDAAGFRHPEWDFEDKPSNTNFVTLDETGTVATIANGAGLAMATVDAVTSYGMMPANFLDIGGGASSASVLAAFEKIMEYPHVKAIVINIFAGITRCDEVAKAIIEARSQIDTLPPLCIRLAGTNYEAAVELLQAEGIAILPTLQDCLAAAKQEVIHG